MTTVGDGVHLAEAKREWRGHLHEGMLFYRMVSKAGLEPARPFEH